MQFQWTQAQIDGLKLEVGILNGTDRADDLHLPARGQGRRPTEAPPVTEPEPKRRCREDQNRTQENPEGWYDER